MSLRALAATLIVTSALIAATAEAAPKPIPTALRVPAGEALPLRQQTASRFHLGMEVAAAPCSVGSATDTLLNLVDYIVPPEDIYFSLLRQSACTFCPTSTPLRLSAAHIVLSFSTLPCTVYVETALIGAQGPESCPGPNQSQELCPPTNFVLVPTDAGTVDFRLPYSSLCTFTGRAYLRFKIDLGGACEPEGERPLLVTNDQCYPCTSYNLFESFLTELCDPESSFPGNPLMYAEGVSCGVLDVVGPAPSSQVQLAAFPNPAPSGVTIQFALPRAAASSLRIYDLSGALVKTLTAGQLEAGMHMVLWDRSTADGGRARPGVYFYELSTGGVRMARRVVVLQ